jgi:surfactin synthase thioesterase subunit
MTQMLARSPWFPYRQSEAPGLQLFCLPPASGGASSYRAWRPALKPGIDVIPVELPGRETRLAEHAVTDAAELVERLADAIQENAPERFALFGHSMGAMLAYELASELSDRGLPPAHLVVSGNVPSHLDDVAPVRTTVAGMSDVELRDYMAEHGGTDEEVLANDELMDLLLPLLRADLAVCESHRWTPRAPLTMPITALGGNVDRGVPAELLVRWSELTGSDFRMRMFPGGHHYLFDQVSAVTAAVSTALLIPGRDGP